MSVELQVFGKSIQYSSLMLKELDVTMSTKALSTLTVITRLKTPN